MRRWLPPQPMPVWRATPCYRASAWAARWGRTLSLDWNALSFGRLRVLVAAAGARIGLALIAFERAVPAALDETEGALAASTRSQQQVQALFAREGISISVDVAKTLAGGWWLVAGGWWLVIFHKHVSENLRPVTRRDPYA